MENFKGKSVRRFERIQLDENLEKTSRIFLAVSVEWDGGEKSTVFDMSYLGMALSSPKGLKLGVGERYTLSLLLGDLSPIAVEVEVMRFDEKLVGVAFKAMSSESRIIFNRFLDDKILGAGLHEVSRKLFGENIDCTHWFQGAGDTNVYLWIEEKDGKPVVASVNIELDDFHLHYKDGKVLEIGGGASEGGFHSKYGEITAEVDVKELALREKDFVSRVVGLLSQIQSLKAPLSDVIQNLSKLEM